MKIYFSWPLANRVLIISLSATVIAIAVYLGFNLILELFLKKTPQLNNHHDFLAFYSAAYLVLHGQAAKIFDPTAVANFEHLIVPHRVGAAGYMPFLNPPFVAVFLTPLALFSASVSRIIWFVLNLFLYLLIVVWLTKGLSGKSRVLGVILLLGTFPAYQALIEAQLSFIVLLGCLAAFYFAKRRCYFWSGCSLSVLLIKPQLAAVVLLGLILFRGWRILWGIAASGLAMVLVTLPITRLQLYIVYSQFALGVFSSHFSGAGSLSPTVWQGTLYRVSGINGLFVALFGQSSTTLVNISTAILGLVLIGFYLLAIRKIKPSLDGSAGKMLLAASITLVLLLDLHLYAQDVVLLYLTIPLLLNYFKNSVLVVVGIALITDLLLISNVVLMHSFTICLIAFTLFICFSAIRKNSMLQSLQLPGSSD